jgi:hypothetical protein
METGMGLFEHLSTDELRKAHNNLLHAIPGDPTFHATVGALLRGMLSYEISNPDRVAADKAAVEAAAEPPQEAA